MPLEAYIPLHDDRGNEIASLRIVATNDTDDQSIFILGSVEALSWTEECIQIVEGRSYDYELELPYEGCTLAGSTFKPGRLGSKSVERGRLEPGQFTGCLPIFLLDERGNTIAKSAIEVRSTKLDYRTDYRKMLDDIAAHSIDLIFDVRTPSSTRLNVNQSKSVSSNIQKLFLLKHFLDGAAFKNAASRILRNPHEKSASSEYSVPISQGLRPRAATAKEIASRHPRISVPITHPISRKVETLPRHVSQIRPLPTRDTPENRFIKYMLRSLDQFLQDIYQTLDGSRSVKYKSIILEVARLRREISAILESALMRELPDHFHGIPFSSPVLQKKPGYRELFQIWLSLQLAAEIYWDGADDVFLGGKKDVATLYEYWVFFELLATVKKIFEMDINVNEELIDVDSSGLFIKLKSGKRLDFLGSWLDGDRPLRVRFSYNRTFSRKAHPFGDAEKSYPNPGSWTRPMRPDFTISLWPSELSEREAEFSEDIKHIHFDAKYRVEFVNELFGGEDDFDDGDERYSKVKRSDLLKMHSYKDAIRRSVSAFVLYPGEESKSWRQFEEIIPGLGAITVRPDDRSSHSDLENYLITVAKYVASVPSPTFATDFP